jgi:Protein of unknown function (DUF2845)
VQYRRLKAWLPGALALIAAHHACGNTLRCGDRLIEVGEVMATVRSLCGTPADVQHSVVANTTITGAGNGSRTTVGAEVAVEVWTYNRGPNQLMVSIRFVDGKVVAIDTLHEYGH